MKERERYARWVGQDDVPSEAVLVVSVAAFRCVLNDQEIKYDPIRHAIGQNRLLVSRDSPGPFYFLPPNRKSGRILFVGGPNDHKLITLSDWPEAIATVISDVTHAYRKAVHQTPCGAVYLTYDYAGLV